VGTSLAYRLWRDLEIGASIDYFGGTHHNDGSLLAADIQWGFGG